MQRRRQQEIKNAGKETRHESVIPQTAKFVRQRGQKSNAQASYEQQLACLWRSQEANTVYPKKEAAAQLGNLLLTNL